MTLISGKLGILIDIFGLVSLIKLVNLVFTVFWPLIRKPKNLRNFGEWSVITGATDGIGKAIALELAQNGQNLIIIGRNESKLQLIKNEISGKNPKIDVKTVVIDLSDINDDSRDRFKQALDGCDVGIVVNNAGLSYDFLKYFHEVNPDQLEDIVKVNSLAPVVITRMLIELFYEKKKGAIVNISSAGSIVPHQLHAVYSASKIFLNKFSEDINQEYESHGISVSTQMPFFVVSKMSKMKRSSFTVPTPAQYAKYSVKQIGYSGLICPYPSHAIMLFVVRLLPEFIINQYITYQHKWTCNESRKITIIKIIYGYRYLILLSSI